MCHVGDRICADKVVKSDNSGEVHGWKNPARPGSASGQSVNVGPVYGHDDINTPFVVSMNFSMSFNGVGFSPHEPSSKCNRLDSTW